VIILGTILYHLLTVMIFGTILYHLLTVIILGTLLYHLLTVIILGSILYHLLTVMIFGTILYHLLTVMILGTILYHHGTADRRRDQSPSPTCYHPWSGPYIWIHTNKQNPLPVYLACCTSLYRIHRLPSLSCYQGYFGSLLLQSWKMPSSPETRVGGIFYLPICTRQQLHLVLCDALLTSLGICIWL
jgi:hypothetical protein